MFTIIRLQKSFFDISLLPFFYKIELDKIIFSSHLRGNILLIIFTLLTYSLLESFVTNQLELEMRNGLTLLEHSIGTISILSGWRLVGDIIVSFSSKNYYKRHKKD